MTISMYPHQDRLSGLGEVLPLNRKLGLIHDSIRDRFEFIDRIAVAAYEPKTGRLKTFLHSSDGGTPLVRYEAALKEAPSLRTILQVGKPRVVNDLGLFSDGTHEHTRSIARKGYGSSYTLPLNLNGSFWGFLFFNSYRKECFTEPVLRDLDVYGHLIGSVVTSEIAAIRTLMAAVKTAHDMVHLRDPETGAHLDRMAEFSRVIAQDLAARGIHSFDDEYIEQLYLFAPLHDLGKIGIPDRILQKAGKLTDREFEAMKIHSLNGLIMINTIAENFGLEHFSRVDILRNIAQFHHEAIDGTGYPQGLKGKDIPIEARIIAVADVFDALTSRRPYKVPWTNDEAFAMLRRLSRTKLDEDCVEALVSHREKVEEIQARHGKDTLAGG